MNWIQAVLLGAVEGITEYLPISSTGHLILVSTWLGLHGESVKTFEVVIQSGAIAAVIGLYWPRIRSMNRELAFHLAISFLPAAVMGLLLHQYIKSRLFGAEPVLWALAVGGLFMIGIDRWMRSRPRQGQLDSLTALHALGIGLAQCLALWPGTSRAMVTMVAGMLCGLEATAAAEYSFLLALPTLGAATLLDAVQGGPALIQQIGWLPLLIGFTTACGVAVLAMRGLIRYLTDHGLALFGWYRLVIAGLLWWVVR